MQVTPPGWPSRLPGSGAIFCFAVGGLGRGDRERTRDCDATVPLVAWSLQFLGHGPAALSTSSLTTVTATRSRRSTVLVHGTTCVPSALTWRRSTLRSTGVHFRPRRQQRSCCALRALRLPALRHPGFSCSHEPIFFQP